MSEDSKTVTARVGVHSFASNNEEEMQQANQSSGGRLASNRTDNSAPKTVKATDYGTTIGEGFKMPFSSRVRVGSDHQQTERIMRIKSKKGDKIVGDSNSNTISDDQTKKGDFSEF